MDEKELEKNSDVKPRPAVPPAPAHAQAAVPNYYQPYIPRNRRPEYIEFKSGAVSPKGLIITVLSILLCIFYTETVLLGSTGISVPIFAIAFYCTLFYYFRDVGSPLNKSAVYLTFPVMLLSFSFFIHYNPSTQFITWLTLIGIICIQLIMFGKKNVEDLFSFDMLIKILINLIGRPFSNLGMPFLSFEVLKGNKSKTLRNLILVLIGLVISLPLAVILMSLFMSADAFFADAVNTVIDFIGLDFANIFADLFLGFISGIFLAAALLGLKYEKEKEKASIKLGNSIDSIITGTFLTIINIFLIAFVAFQFVYLFGGTVNITVSGMSYAEYARRGFFELTAASFLIFAIALFVLFMTKRKEEKLPLWVKLGTVSLCACNGVLLVSAVKRMLLYVDAYGLSVKRVLTLWLMCIIGLCLIWLIAKCFIGKMNVLKWIGITVIAGVCILSLANTERLIAGYNIDRYISDPDKISLDVSHLSQLSYTTAPEIAKLDDSDLKGPIKKDDVEYILNNQKLVFESRNSLYGFTLDSIAAENVFEKHLKK